MVKKDEVYEAFKFARSQKDNSSSDYITIRLSTKGNVYAPKVFHIKNFTVREVQDISLTEKENIANRVFSLLCTKVLEKDVDLGSFTREEYVETIFYIFKSFYAASIKSQDYTLQDNDYTYLQNMNGGPTSPEYLKMMNDLKNGVWQPKVNIDLNNVRTYSLPETFIKKATIGNPNRGFWYSYGLPSIRDILDLDEFVRFTFKEESTKYESIEKLITLRNDMFKRRLNGEDIPLESIPTVPKSIENQYNDYMYKKQMMYSRGLHAAYLRNVNGEDISKLLLEDKMKYLADPRISLKAYTDFVNKIKDQKFGLYPDIQIVDPITNNQTMYPFSFDGLIAFKPFETDTLYELIISLSKNTANDASSIFNMQMEQLLSLHNTLAKLAEKEKEESEKQRDEQMKSTNNLTKNGFGMNNIQGQFNKMSSGFKMPSMPNMSGFHM